MSIKTTTNAKLNAIKRKSAQTLPNRPSNQGMSAEQIKNAFWKFVLDNEDSVISEITRIVNEANIELDKKLTKLTNSQMSEITSKHILDGYELNNGDLFIVIDDGNYKIGHIYKLEKLDDDFKFNDLTSLLYNNTGENEDGSMTQKIVTKELKKKVDKDQGEANVGKILIVGDGGEIVPSPLTLTKTTSEDGIITWNLGFLDESENEDEGGNASE